MRLRVRSLASLSGLRIQHCRELRCRSQTGLGPCIAVAVVQAGSSAPIQALAWEFSYAEGMALKKDKEKKRKKEKRERERDLGTRTASTGDRIGQGSFPLADPSV